MSPFRAICSTDERLRQETLCRRQWTDEYVEQPETSSAEYSLTGDETFSEDYSVQKLSSIDKMPDDILTHSLTLPVTQK